MALIWISCAWLAGTYLGTHVPITPAVAALGLIPFLLVPLFSRQYLKPIVLIALSLLALLGAASFSGPRSFTGSPVAQYNNHSGRVQIRGIVRSPAEVSGQVLHVEVSAEQIFLDNTWQPTSGTVLVYAPLYPEYRYGDRLLIAGKLEDPPVFDDFDYQSYLAKQGIYSTLLKPEIKLEASGKGSPVMAAIYAFRARMAESLSRALPEPQASLTQGILLGIRGSIPQDLKTDLSTTGTAQLLAISGLNLTIVAGLLIALGLRLFGRRRFIYLWLALALIWFYAVLTGIEPPVIRAAIMSTVFLVAELLGRQKNAHVALAFSAAVMVGISPGVLWEASFQLSFLAMLGLVLITPVLDRFGRRIIASRLGEEGAGQWIGCLVWDSLSVTLGAIFMVWPLVAYYFGLVSIVGPLANLLIAPALPLIILTGALTAFIGLAGAPAAQAAGWISWVPVTYMLWMTHALAALPAAAVEMGRASSALVWGYYLFLLLASLLFAKLRNIIDLVVLWLSRLRGPLQDLYSIFERTPKKLIVLPLLILVLPVCIAAVNLPDRELHVSFLDVGEGDATLIQVGNQNVLVDGGPDSQAVVRGLGSKMKFWQKDIDLMVLTHPHLDHLTGLVEVLRRYNVKRVLAPALTAQSPVFSEWETRIDEAHIPRITASAGQILNLAGGARLTVLNAGSAGPGLKDEDMENLGLVLRLSLGQVSVLLTADVDQNLENTLISNRAELSSTILKVSHHGSNTASSSQFLALVDPVAAVISVGADNRFGHPDPAAIKRLTDELGSAGGIYRTDLSGTIEFTSDGRRLWVKSERP